MNYSNAFFVGLIALSLGDNGLLVAGKVHSKSQNKPQANQQQSDWKEQAPAFLKAATEGDLAMLKAMLASGIDVNITDGILNCSALMVASAARERAVDRRQSDAIRLLVDHGASVNQVDETGACAIDYILHSRAQDCLYFLLKNSRNSDPLKKNSSPQEILKREKNRAPKKAAFLAEAMEHVAHGESRTVTEMVLIDQRFPQVVTSTILPYIGHEETQKEREQTVQWLQSLLLAELVQAGRSSTKK